MSTFITKPINVPLGKTDCYKQLIADKCALKLNQIKSVTLHKQSVDARDKSNVHFVFSFLIDVDKSFVRNAEPYVAPIDVLQNAQRNNNFFGKKIVVCGAGPAGLFCALYLSKLDFDVTVVEKGEDIAARKKSVDEFVCGGAFCPDSNIQFGLGGAGTFSDGKLTTGISSPLTYSVFRQFVRSGAPDDIFYSALPHIGTDKLVNVVAELRDEIIANGGKFLFGASLCGFVKEGESVVACRVFDGTSETTIQADGFVVATGHSSRDVFELLRSVGANVVPKAFAVGLRVEHTREFIDNAQYGLFATHRDLSAASYKLVHNGAKHSCYSFCMCPGGYVVPANSEADTVVVNGMSNYARDAVNSNSALVVTVSPDDISRFGYGNDVFSGMRFQQDLERRAYALGRGNYVAPCQNVTDFALNKLSDGFSVAPSYKRGVKSANLRTLLPDEITESICEALAVFDRKIKGFGSCGVLTGVETRTSAPVRILRGDDFQSNVGNIYPTGEGAGYAGGIVSSAVDGLRVAQAICTRFSV